MDILAAMVMLGSISLHRMIFGTESPVQFSHTETTDTDITAIGMPLDTEEANIYQNRFGDHPNGIPINFFNSFNCLSQSKPGVML